MRGAHGYLVLDIETVPDHTRWQRPELAPGVEPPFPPAWAHRVIVVGCLLLDSNYGLVKIGDLSQPDERELLREFSGFVGKRQPTLVTYNGRSFDLPVIALRSLCHGVPLPWYYQGRGVRYRYSEEGHMDLCDWLADHGATRSGTLDAIARLIGLPGKYGVDGSQVEGLYQTGQLTAIENYCLADVVQTAFVFLRFRLLQGQLAPALYHRVASDLFAQLAADARVAELMKLVDQDALLLPPAAGAPDENGTSVA